jgi:hypothetical protein
MLLIISTKNDAHVHVLFPHLERRGIEYRWIEPGDFPAHATIAIEFGPGSPVQALARYDESPLDLADVTAVWYRRPSSPCIDDRLTAPDHRRCAVDVSEACLLGLADLLGDARWLPGTPRAEFAASNKIEQLARAQRFGLTVPRTLVTNDPEQYLRFSERMEGQMITKLVRYVHGVKGPDDTMHVFFTRPMRRRDKANMRALRYAPMILQEYVPKRVELRATVVGKRIFTAAIDSQASSRTRHDWRHYDLLRNRYEPHALPEGTARQCIDLVASYGLCFGALDLVLTPSGEYVFLELNPNGQWGFIEDLARLPIAEAIVDELTGAGPGYNAPASSSFRSPEVFNVVSV